MVAKARPSRPLPGMAALAPPLPARPRPKQSQASTLEREMMLQIRALQLPTPETEVRFHPVRRWRWDLAWPDRMLAVEIHGGGFVAGRHGRGMGLENDAEKLSNGTLLGWRVLVVTGAQIKDGRALRWVWEALGGADAYKPGPTPAA